VFPTELIHSFVFSFSVPPGIVIRRTRSLQNSKICKRCFNNRTKRDIQGTRGKKCTSYYQAWIQRGSKFCFSGHVRDITFDIMMISGLPYVTYSLTLYSGLTTPLYIILPGSSRAAEAHFTKHHSKFPTWRSTYSTRRAHICHCKYLSRQYFVGTQVWSIQQSPSGNYLSSCLPLLQITSWIE